jgi:4-hydroxybenzoate polyprenyltransferase
MLCATGVCLRNALCDIEIDRAAGRVEKSPFASGQIPIMTGLWLAPVLFGLGLAVAVCCAPHFWFWPLAYAALSVNASTWRQARPMFSYALGAAAGVTPLLAGFAIFGLSCPGWMEVSLWMLFLAWAVASRVDTDAKNVS